MLKHLPETGETFTHDGWKFEVVDMDGRKIDKLIASRPKRRSPRDRRQAEAGAARASRTSLEAVDVAARQIVGLLDDPVARRAGRETARVGCRAARSRLRSVPQSDRNG